MLGYMTVKEAKAAGMTNHGSYYGIPLWIACSGNGCSVAAKWSPMDNLSPLFAHIEGFIRSVMFPDDEPCFQFKVGSEIK